MIQVAYIKNWISFLELRAESSLSFVNSSLLTFFIDIYNIKDITRHKVRQQFLKKKIADDKKNWRRFNIR